MQPATVRSLLFFVAAWALLSLLVLPAAAVALAGRFLESPAPLEAAAAGIWR